ncbi:hypothetical protein Tco_0328680 [Tanacetum coccineum]
MASSSSSSFQVLNHQLCYCDLLKPNAMKKCRLWNWFDKELKSDWYRIQLNEMYYLLNPNQMCLLENEIRLMDHGRLTYRCDSRLKGGDAWLYDQGLRLDWSDLRIKSKGLETLLDVLDPSLAGYK